VGTSRGYKYSRLRCGGRRLLRHGDAKNARCARVFAPRSASLFLFRPFPSPNLFPPNIFLANLTRPGPPEFPTRSDGGSRGFTEPHPTFPPRSALHPRTQPSPPTPPDGHASRPRRGPQRTQANNASESPATFTEFSHLNFFCLPGPSSRRSSDLSITSILGQHACTTTKTKHVVFPVTRPQIGFFTKTPSVAVRAIRAQGALSLSMAFLSPFCP
jgi:hypothetical protein